MTDDAPNSFLLYTAPDGGVRVECRIQDETLWLTQKRIAELFGVGVPAINKHLKNIFETGELLESATISKMEIVQTEGTREVSRPMEFYNLDAIIAVGYRVNRHFAAMPWDEIKMQPGLGLKKIRSLMEMFAAALD